MKREKLMTAILLAFLLGAIAVHGDAETEARLPLNRLVLFSSGVGYFQREGFVEGEAAQVLEFKTAEINDLLKSMVLRDFDGGTVSAVNYASRDPLAKTLKGFRIDLTGNPGLAAILGQLRGLEIETGDPERLRGTVVGVEVRIVGQESPHEEPFVNLLTSKGLRSVGLSALNEVRMTDPKLEQELRQALALIAESRSTDRRRVQIRFAGQGKRRVQVGYILETPVWKTSYRLVLGKAKSHLLQGWAIVENTTNEDWKDVELSLVSGRPISFTMDLYRPLYVARPEVRLEMQAAVAPPVYEEDLMERDSEMEAAKELAAPAGAPAPSMRARREEAAAAKKPAGEAQGFFDIAQGVKAAAAGEEVGEFFQYAIEHPVSLARQESAMLPIVSRNLEGERVSIYNEQVHAKHPLNGLRLKNSTGLHLKGGPITVFEEGTYAGDAQIEDLPDGAERLVSFSMDLDVEVESSARSLPDTLVTVSINRGSLFSTRLLKRERTYTIKNTGQRPRLLLIEHPSDPNWKLVEPASPAERARNVYRFAVSVEPRKDPRSGSPGSARLQVREEQQQEQRTVLSNLSPSWIETYIQAREVSPAVKAALKRMQELSAELADTIRERQLKEKEIQQIHSEQSRIRSNMGSVSSDSSLYKRYVTMLNKQEDDLNRLHERLEDLQKRELAQKKAQEDYLLSLDVK